MYIQSELRHTCQRVGNNITADATKSEVNATNEVALSADTYSSADVFLQAQVRYRPVDCQPDTPITLGVMYGQSGRNFLKFTAQNVAGHSGIKSVQIATIPGSSNKIQSPQWLKMTTIADKGDWDGNS